MSEPEFYEVVHSGVMFDKHGKLVQNDDGSYHTYYGIDGVHTWKDWHLYCTDPSISSPEVEKYLVSVPGRHGMIDMSEALTGAPVFHNRKIQLTFLRFGSMESWHSDYTEILEALHGQEYKLIFDTDPGYYYEGRCSVSSVREDGVHSSFSIEMDAYPYKKAISDTASDWLWDPFCFENGVIREYKDMKVEAGEEKEFLIIGCAMPVYPKILVSSDAPESMRELVINGVSTDISGVTSGYVSFPWPLSYPLSDGENKIRIENTSSHSVLVSIVFAEGRL